MGKQTVESVTEKGMRQAREGCRVEVESPGATGACEDADPGPAGQGPREFLISSKLPAEANAAGPQSTQENTFLSSTS